MDTWSKSMHLSAIDNRAGDFEISNNRARGFVVCGLDGFRCQETLPWLRGDVACWLGSCGVA